MKLDTYAHRGGGLRKTEDVTVMSVTKRDSFRRQPFGMIKVITMVHHRCVVYSPESGMFWDSCNNAYVYQAQINYIHGNETNT